MQEAHAWLDARYEEVFNATFYDDARWALPASPELVEATTTGFSSPDSYPVDDRGVAYSWAFFSAKQLGTGQFYLMTIKDKDGSAFDGAATYRLAVPPHVPATLYWSATAYDRATHTLIRDTAWASRSSNTPGLETNEDGSVTLFFAPEPPTGARATGSPHKRTVNSKSFVLLRARESFLRQDVEAAGRRTGALNRRTRLTPTVAAAGTMPCLEYDDIRESQNFMSEMARRYDGHR